MANLTTSGANKIYAPFPSTCDDVQFYVLTGSPTASGRHLFVSLRRPHRNVSCPFHHKRDVTASKQRVGAAAAGSRTNSLCLAVCHNAMDAPANGVCGRYGVETVMLRKAKTWQSPATQGLTRLWSPRGPHAGNSTSLPMSTTLSVIDGSASYSCLRYQTTSSARFVQFLWCNS